MPGIFVYFEKKNTIFESIFEWIFFWFLKMRYHLNFLLKSKMKKATYYVYDYTRQQKKFIFC